jgi:hypothetical protein
VLAVRTAAGGASSLLEPEPGRPLAPGDRLLVKGLPEAIAAFQTARPPS